MGDQLQLPAVGSVWRKGDEVRTIDDVLYPLGDGLFDDEDDEAGAEVYYTTGKGLEKWTEGSRWLAWAEDATEVSE